ncbi:DUF4432 family protein [Paenibacillus sacheonensis]|uniref:DUF4432 family protein n=1 Tax=Paenibacillus sacheonensis TaxID=742054 RepID=A0A7X4YL34_9BACL|nr:DUF4432 family protein [Paenibacillus sacheonensis]MBM7564026.1 hypothetical protein [Paenibacillus sacheonensis]NBC67641.1 DUF4432 family protein [Paenibacillus sacheonensis]
MGVKVDTNWTYNEIRTVVMENEKLRVVVMPELGAKIWQIVYKPRDKELLWHHPRMTPRKLQLHASYDDHFFGGWDELYPNDETESIGGETFPDHGEIWTLPWHCAIERSDEQEAVLRLWVETPISATRIVKTITLRAGEAKLRFRHAIENKGRRPQPYLWKLHAAMSANESYRIDLPAEEVRMESFGSPRTGRTSYDYAWPYAEGADGSLHDMRQVLPFGSGVSEFQYATKMRAGWCALTDTKDGIGFGLSYDREALPSCWIFASYGGWRELQTVVLEPCTGYPAGLADGVERGTHKTLEPGQTALFDIVATVYDGYRAVEGIDGDGNVTGPEFRSHQTDPMSSRA